MIFDSDSLHKLENVLKIRGKERIEKLSNHDVD